MVRQLVVKLKTLLAKQHSEKYTDPLDSAWAASDFDDGFEAGVKAERENSEPLVKVLTNFRDDTDKLESDNAKAVVIYLTNIIEEYEAALKDPKRDKHE